MRSGHSLGYRRFYLVALALTLAVSVRPAAANSPVFTHSIPDGGQRGTDVTLSLQGQRLTGTEEVIFYEPGITVTKLEPISDGELRATFQIAPDCRLGEHALRLRTKLGWTTMHTFYVGPYPTAAEAEPNGDFAAPQKVALNSTVAGVVTNEDVDYYAVEAKKGQRISAEIEGIRLGITLFDPYVAILDAKRFELDAADDTALLRQDAFASIIAPEDGTYVVMVRESAYGGNDACRYRLHVGEFPRPPVVYPLGGQPGESINFRFIGDEAGPIEQAVTLPNDGREEASLFATLNGQGAPSPNRVRVAAMPNVPEAEPNDAIQAANGSESPAPVAFNGVIEKDGDYDFYKFTATAGQSLEFRVFAREYGSPVDPVIYIYKADGTFLAANDDGAGRLDSLHVQQMPETGTYYALVFDHLRKSGPDYVYRLEVAPATPRLTLMMPEVARYDDQNRQFASVPRGNRWMILMQANREYFGGPLKFACDDLPPGVTMHAPVVHPSLVFVPVVFEAAADAPIGGKLCDLRAAHAEQPQITGRWKQTVALVRGEPNQVPYYSTSMNRLPVAVTEAAPFSVKIVEPKVPLVRDGQMGLKIVVERAEGFKEPVYVQLPFRPPGLGAEYQITIPPEQSEAFYPMNATGDAAEGDWPLAAMAFATVNGGYLFTSSQLATIKIAPHVVTGQIAMAVTEQGQPAEVIVQLNQVTAFEGEATLHLIGLPPKCATEPVKIAAGAAQAVFKVTTDKESPAGQHKSLFCQIVLPKDGEEIRQNLAGGGVIRLDEPKPAEVAAAPQPEATAAPAEPAPSDQPKKVLSRLEQLRLEQQQRSKQ